MGDRIKISNGGGSVSAPLGIGELAPMRSEKPIPAEPPPELAPDQAGLSLAYWAIRKSAIAVRIRTLRLRFATRSYSIPAADVSRSMILDHLVRA